MSSESISCPYCNAIVAAPLPAGTPAAVCPRCGEKLPARLLQAITTEPTAAPGGPGFVRQVDVDALRAAEQRPSKKMVRGIVLGIMAIMAILSFAYAWNTVEIRRSRDPKFITPPPPVVERRVPPIELAALGYLRPDTSAIAAIHVAQAERTPAGKDLLQRFRLGGTVISVADLDKWTGIKLSDIDHAVVGVTVDNRVLPAVILAVETRRPYDAEAVRQTLKAGPATELGSRTVYRFTPAVGSKVSFDAALWFASPTIVVVGLSRNDLDKVPERPTSDTSQLSASLRGVIKERLPRADAWLAGHVEKWEAVSLLLGFVLDKDSMQTLSQVRTFAFGLQFDDGVRLQGAVRCADEGATAALEKKWSKLAVPQGGTLPQDLRPMLQEFAETYQREVKDGWLEIEARASGKSLQSVNKN